MLSVEEIKYRTELQQLARDIVRFEKLTIHAAMRRRWRDVMTFQYDREHLLDRRYSLLRHYLALRQSNGQGRWWWQ